MPKLIVKTEYILKLYDLGVYFQWLKNVKDSWGISSTKKLDSSYLNASRNQRTWTVFIQSSFSWEQTSQGDDFWNDISTK